MYTHLTEQFLVPDWGMKPAMASGCRTGPTEAVFVDLLRSQESISSLAGRYGNPICLTGSRGYTGWAE